MSMRPKEPSFFVDQVTLKNVYPAMEKLGIWKNEMNYLELYKGAGSADYIGDASQNYSRMPLVKGVPERIRDFCRNAKILYIVRDPVDRTISHYWYMVKNFGESRPILEAIKSSDDYVSTSYYAMQLTPYLRIFGAENVKVVISEELREKPQLVMRDIYSWLNVDETSSISLEDRVSYRTFATHECGKYLEISFQKAFAGLAKSWLNALLTARRLPRRRCSDT